MDNDLSLRKHLLELLRGGSAHTKPQQVLTGWPARLRGVRLSGLPYTPWQLLEHLRIAQWDILEFSRNAGHVSPDFPDGYWPDTAAPPTQAAWGNSVRQFQSDLKEMEKLVEDPATDLFDQIPHGHGQTILREALLVADHNAYHLGELVVMRRLMGVWQSD